MTVATTRVQQLQEGSMVDEHNQLLEPTDAMFLGKGRHLKSSTRVTHFHVQCFV